MKLKTPQQQSTTLYVDITSDITQCSHQKPKPIKKSKLEFLATKNILRSIFDNIAHFSLYTDFRLKRTTFRYEGKYFLSTKNIIFFETKQPRPTHKTSTKTSESRSKSFPNPTGL